MAEARLQIRSQGDLSHRDWQNEGEHLYISARHMRLSFLQEIRKIKKAVTFSEKIKVIPKAHQKINAFPKAAMLLLGYAVEMYLKSGLAKFLLGCSEELFRCTLREYSHDYKRLACDLHLSLGEQCLLDLESLSAYVKNDARYPVSVGPNETYVYAFNKRSRSMNNAKDFRRFCLLAKRIRRQVNLINNNSKAPATLHSWTVDGDGYLALRLGGNLPAHAIMRYSSLQRESPSPFANMAELAIQSSTVCRFYWDTFKFYEDMKTNKGRKLVAITAE